MPMLRGLVDEEALRGYVLAWQAREIVTKAGETYVTFHLEAEAVGCAVDEVLATLAELGLKARRLRLRRGRSGARRRARPLLSGSSLLISCPCRTSAGLRSTGAPRTRDLFTVGPG